jgi:hypothetical protein
LSICKFLFIKWITTKLNNGEIVLKNYFLIILVMLLSSLPVSLTAGGSLSVCSQGCDFSSIQAAVDHKQTHSGDIIRIMESIHTEAGITINKSITLEGAHAKETILQAHENAELASDRILTVIKGVEVVIRNLAMRHGKPSGYPASGGAINNYGNLKITNSVVSKNTAGTSGGGIWNNGSLTLENSHISHNTALRRGQIGYACGSGGGIQNEKGSKLVIKNSSIQHNNSEKSGGGLFISCDTTALIENSTISHNSAQAPGGGITVKGGLSLKNSSITNNQLGGLAVYGTVKIKNSFIRDNHKGADCSLPCRSGKCGRLLESLHNDIGGGTCLP